jgi:OFA family oxalate/formate antiporter-like MFS transporter
VAIASVASTPDTTGINRWWRVIGGLSMNIALGTLYAWSVFVAPLEKEFGWKRAETSNVFTIAAVVFALTFVAAGGSDLRISSQTPRKFARGAGCKEGAGGSLVCRPRCS